ncbi:MAG TPA: CBS domain-containing protein, partial [Longimicrobiales bacterium]
LLIGCSAAYMVSLLLAPHSIMTEKLARRGRIVRTEYSADFLSQMLVRDVTGDAVTCVHADDTIGELRAWFASDDPAATHQGFPVVDEANELLGVVTRRDILSPRHPDPVRVRDTIKKPPAVTFDDNTLREAADHMVREGVGRLPVVKRDEPSRVIGIISRSDLLAAHHRRLTAASTMEEGFASRIRLRFPNR